MQAIGMSYFVGMIKLPAERVKNGTLKIFCFSKADRSGGISLGT